MQIGVEQQEGLNGAWKRAVREELGMSLDCAPSSLSLALSSSLSHSLSHCPPCQWQVLSQCPPYHTPCLSHFHTCCRTPCHKSSLSHCSSCHIACHFTCLLYYFTLLARLSSLSHMLLSLIRIHLWIFSPAPGAFTTLYASLPALRKGEKIYFTTKTDICRSYSVVLQLWHATSASHCNFFLPLYIPLLLHGKAFIGCHMCLCQITEVSIFKFSKGQKWLFGPKGWWWCWRCRWIQRAAGGLQST